jgi:sugar lactone lactonase YvrE
MSFRRFTFAPLLLVAACGPSADPIDAGTDAPLADDAPEGSDAPTTPTDAGPPRVEVFAALGAGSEGIAIGHDSSGASRIFLALRDDRIVSVTPDGTVSDLATIDAPVGIAFREPGEIIACASADGASGLFSITLDGTVTMLTNESPEGLFGLTNFVAIAPDGSLVFTDSMANRVYRADADGTNVTEITDAVTYPNGLAFSPDGTRLYIASWSTTTLYVASFEGGSYGTPMPIVEGVGSVDGIVARGASELVLITSSTGGLLVDTTMPTADPVTYFDRRAIAVPANAVFGDETFGEDELFVSALGAPSLFVVHPE